MTPIAYPPAAGSSISSDSAKILYSDITVPAAPPLLLGAAVAVVDNGGSLEFALCGAGPADNLDGFIGFMGANGVPGQTAAIITGRGSKVTPIVTGGGPLTIGNDLYLSTTAGEVSQTPPAGSGVMTVRVANAISATVVVLTTDTRILIG